MGILLFYFTGTGNTLWAANRFAESLARCGANARLLPIGQAPAEDGELAELVRSSDRVCFAYPIYGAGMPPAMKAFLDRLARLYVGGPRKPACCIATFGYVNSFGPLEARRLLAASGFELKCHVNVHLCNNLSTPLARTDPVPPEKIARRKEKAAAKLDRAAAAFVAGKSHIRGIGPWLLAGHFIRKFSAPLIGQQYKVLAVDLDQCKRCMACVAQCPTGSIVYREGEGFEFLPTCTACSRCYNHCPAAAVTIGGMVADPEVYVRYTGIGE